MVVGHEFTKDPDAVKDYVFDWGTKWLKPGDTIFLATVFPDDGLTLDSTTKDDTTVTAWVSGGTAGQNYDLRCHITTTGGRQDDWTFKIKVRQQ
jgi:hypothetical protein